MKEKVLVLVHRHKLSAFLVTVVGLAAVLVLVSMSVYYSSGAYQLDLSRPEYKGVRSQIERDKKTDDTFDTQGEVDAAVIDDFLGRYQQEADKALKADAYGTDVLSNEQLGI